MAPRRIGELLVAEGLISEAAITRALGYQRVSGERVKLGSILLGWDLLSEDELLAGLAKFHRCPAVPWETLMATPIETVRILSGAHAIRLGAIPYGAEKGLVRVAFINPSNLATVDEVSALTGRRVVPGVATEARLLQAQQKFYGRHVPLEYRPILQKLQRRTTTTTLRAVVDFRESDIVETQRAPTGSGEIARAFDSASIGEPPAVSIPVEPASSAPDPVISRDQPLALPEFPALAAQAPTQAPAPTSEHTSLRSGDDSLTEWVGRALSSFTGEEHEPADPGPSGVPDPSQFGRDAEGSAESGEDPGALDLVADSLPPTNAFRPRPSEAVRRPSLDGPTEAHRLGVPASIPPFRRSTDPRIPPDRPDGPSLLDREDDIVAGMWRPDPDQPSAGVDADDSRGAETSPNSSFSSPSPSFAERMEGAAAASDSEETPSGAIRSRDAIADSVLQGSLEQLPRVLLLGTGRTGVTGWRGRGPGLTPDAVTAIRIPNSEISVFSSVHSGIPHFGAIDRAEWPSALASLFGDAPPDCAIFPIRLLDGVAAFLYADRLGLPMQYEDFAIIARAAASAANVLSRFLLRSDRSSSSVRR